MLEINFRTFFTHDGDGTLADVHVDGDGTLADVHVDGVKAFH